ncbi:MurR/RpiR family transcriptional regulator [Salinarimonas ramus]|uniref:RpiR family transcriptional regulator n=1 Tax=Salinarimonas ramus TaxID=690164 RepID=A0A917Q612_9HYPH|nr:MurR/RpiR family transcriptional regulator [Salinarimonas ramus]GGK20616.1 RpiR family transcriptional regulator [Salinarimonas ramus]
MTHGSGGEMDRNESYDSLRARLKARYDDLSPHLQRLARLALDDPNFLALQTITAIAARASVQPSTIVRFAKEFGYDGFSGMQQVFKLRLIEGAPVYRERVFGEVAPIEGDRLARCADALIASLERLKATTPRERIARAVEILARADFVFVAGLRRSRPVSAYLAYGLSRLERRCAVLDFDGGMAGQQVANMRQGDVLCAIAFAEYSPVVVDAVRDAHLRDIPVVAITDTDSSPLALNASVHFVVDDDAHGAFRPISGAIGLVQTLIEEIAAGAASTLPVVQPAAASAPPDVGGRGHADQTAEPGARTGDRRRVARRTRGRDDA